MMSNNRVTPSPLQMLSEENQSSEDTGRKKEETERTQKDQSS